MLIRALFAAALVLPPASRGPDHHGNETLPQAVERLFPGATLKRTTAYLDKDQRARVQGITGDRTAPGVVYPYLVLQEGHCVKGPVE